MVLGMFTTGIDVTQGRCGRRLEVWSTGTAALEKDFLAKEKETWHTVTGMSFGAVNRTPGTAYRPPSGHVDLMDKSGMVRILLFTNGMTHGGRWSHWMILGLGRENGYADQSDAKQAIKFYILGSYILNFTFYILHFNF